MHLLYYMLYKLKYKSVVECYRRALGRKTLSRLACLLSIVYTSVALFIIYKLMNHRILSCLSQETFEYAISMTSESLVIVASCFSLKSSCFKM